MGRRDLDQRADVYGFGAVIFRALAGRPPFSSPHLGQLLDMATSQERPSLRAFRPELPVEVDDWVRQVLAIAPDERFLTIRGSWTALRSVLRF